MKNPCLISGYRVPVRANVTPEQAAKLHRVALHKGCSLSMILTKLIDDMKEEPLWQSTEPQPQRSAGNS